MNSVTIETNKKSVEIMEYRNKVDVEIIRIHTDYPFYSSHQITPEHKEVD